MKLDYNRLSELLNSFGLSLKIENGSVIFVDIETNSPMKSYIVYDRDFTNEVATSDVNTLLNGYYFYLKNESNSKYFRLNIVFKDGYFIVEEITRTKLKEPDLYEECSFGSSTNTSYGITEMTYTRGQTLKSYVSFGAREMDSTRNGMLSVAKNIEDKELLRIWFEKDEETGELSFEFSDSGLKKLDLQEATELIEQSRVFKDTMKTLCPTLAEIYSNVKTGGIKPIR